MDVKWESDAGVLPAEAPKQGGSGAACGLAQMLHQPRPQSVSTVAVELSAMVHAALMMRMALRIFSVVCVVVVQKSTESSVASSSGQRNRATPARPIRAPHRPLYTGGTSVRYAAHATGSEQKALPTATCPSVAASGCDADPPERPEKTAVRTTARATGPKPARAARPSAAAVESAAPATAAHAHRPTHAAERPR